MMRIDPRLRISAETAYNIEMAAMPLFERVTVFMISSYDMPLAAEVVGEGVVIRAATGDEVTDPLTTGGFEEGKGVDWPGDPAEAAGHEMVWQEADDAVARIEPACRLWAGEVTLKSSRGISGPFYVYVMAARAWAISTALALPAGEVFEAQVVPYACARGCAPALMRGGEEEFRRVNRFWASPLRPLGEPCAISLPD